jgi:hypothetical protein
MFAITRFHNFMSLYQGRYATALAKSLGTSVFAAKALDIALSTGCLVAVAVRQSVPHSTCRNMG